MSTNNYIPFSDYYANAVGAAMGNFENNYGISVAAEPSACSSACTGSCSGTCTKSCDISCTAKCASSCSGGCKGTCSDSCTGTCSSKCTGTCASGCTGNCFKTCTDGCETYCANDCQTYCQYEQVYSKNNGKNNPGGKVFSWDTTVAEDKTIFLTAIEWNRLAKYIEDAAEYCTTSSVSITRVASKDPIYASYYNSMNNGVNTIGSSGETNKTAKVDLITASNIDALRAGYNSAKIISTLPSNPTGATGACCQLKESCMTQESGRPSLQPCVDQTCTQSPGK